MTVEQAEPGANVAELQRSKAAAPAEPGTALAQTPGAAASTSARLDHVLVFGATSAMAQELIRLLAARGTALVLVARNAGHLEAVVADARVRGAARVDSLAADLNDTARHATLLDAAFAALGRVDVVLLAQGVLAESDACERDPAQAALVLQTNFTAPALLAQAAALRLAAQGSGTLVAISSVAGDRGRQSNYGYGAAKGGLSIFLAGLRNRMFPRGVRVLTVKPGFIDTPMTAHIAKKSPLFVPPATVAQAILSAIAGGKDTIYVPGFWRLIMFVIRAIPEALFKRLRL